MSAAPAAGAPRALSPVREEAAPQRNEKAKGSAVDPALDTFSLEDQELVKKWRGLELSERLPEIEDIRFLISSDLAFWMQTFKNSSRKGADEHALRFIHGEYCMKMEGRWSPISEVRKNIRLDATMNKLHTIGDASQVWSYVSPDGLVKRDRLAYAKLLPVANMDPEDYDACLKEAQAFWNTNPEPDAGKPKRCIFQVVTTNRKHSEYWATENLAKAWPEHATYRVIKPAADGTIQVYSFGFQMEKSEEDEIFHDKSYPFPLTFTKTTQSKIATPDYEESRQFYKKRITSLTMTDERADSILKSVEDLNAGGGVRFNFIHQNCSTLGVLLLKLAGVVTLPVRWTLGYGLGTLLPDWEKIPVVGAPLAVVIGAIKSVAHKFFAALWSVTPNMVQEVVCFLPRKISTLLCNTLVAFMGGNLASASVKKAEDTENELDNREKFTCFSRLLRTVSDWFREDVSDVQPHLTLIDWQMNQQTTRIAYYENQAKIYF